MVLLVAAALAAAAGVVVWFEARRYERENGQRFRNLDPRFAGAGAFLIACIIGFIASPIVLGAIVGYGLFREATLFEEEQRESPLGISALMWGAAGAVVGLFGALFFTTALWAPFCGYFLLAGALYFALRKNAALTAHRDSLLADNSALIAERTKLMESAKPQTRTLESFERRRATQTSAAQSAWAAQLPPANDLLPRGR
jgi:hypothetical protein